MKNQDDTYYLPTLNLSAPELDLIFDTVEGAIQSFSVLRTTKTVYKAAKNLIFFEGLCQTFGRDYIIDYVDDKKITPLMYALSELDFETAEFLIQYGADLYKTDSNGRNALHYIVAKGSIDLLLWTQYVKNIVIDWNIDGTNFLIEAIMAPSS